MVQYNGEVIIVNLLVDNKYGCLDAGIKFLKAISDSEGLLKGLAGEEQGGM